MIERIARAMLADEINNSPNRNFDTVWEDEKEIWLSNARSAVQAMRNPSDAMVTAGQSAKGPISAWTAMIDVALADE